MQLFTYFLVLFAFTLSETQAYCALTQKQETRLSDSIRRYQKESLNLSLAKKTRYAFQNLARRDFYKLFIDKADQKKRIQDPHLVYEEQEPGYFQGMQKAFDSLIETGDRELDLDELIRLHDLAVDGVSRSGVYARRYGESFSKGLSLGVYYGISRTISQEALNDLFRFNLIHLPSYLFIPFVQSDSELRELYNDLIHSRMKHQLDDIIFDLNERNRMKRGFLFAFFNNCYDVESRQVIEEKIHSLNNERPRNRLANFVEKKAPALSGIFNFSELESFKKANLRGKLVRRPDVRNQIDDLRDFWATLEENLDIASAMNRKCAQDFYHDIVLEEVIEENYKNDDFLANYDGETVYSNLSNFVNDPDLIHSVAEAKLEPYFNEFKMRLRNADTSEDKLGAISVLLRALLIFHMFHDGNGRAVYFLSLNKLLIQNDLPPVILNSPFIFDGDLGTSEIVDALKEGMYNYLKSTNRLK